MSIYFIDFENLRNEALAGIQSLSEKDRVYLFYSNHADSISFEMHQALLECSASISYYKIKRGGKNSLDFQLTCQLSYLMGVLENESFYIVSRDNGFSFVRDFWEQHPVGGNCIKRCTSIQATLQNAEEELSMEQADEEMPLPTSSETDEPAAVISQTPVVESVLTAEEASPEPESISAPESDPQPTSAEPEETASKPQRLRKRTNTVPSKSTKQPPAKKVSLQKALSLMLKEVCDNATMQRVANLLVASQSKQEFYRSTVSLLGQKHGLEVYHVIGNEYHNLKQQCDCL